MPPKKDAAPAGAGGASAEAKLEQQTIIRAGLETQTTVLQNRIAALESAVTAKHADRESIRRDFIEFRSYATVTINRNEAQIEAYKQQLAGIDARKDAEFHAMQVQLTNELAKTRTELTQQISVMKSELESNRLKAREVQEHLAIRDDMERQIAELTHTLEQERQQTKDTIADMERSAVIAAEARRKEQEANWLELKRLARIEAARNMDEEQQAVAELNRSMVHDLRSHIEETKTLASERSTLAAARAALARDVDLLKEAETAWAQRGARQARDIRSLEARLLQVEEAYIADKRRQTAETEAILTDFEYETHQLRTAVRTLRELLELKDEEVQTVKRLASVVLHQRTEVEQLLLDSLNAVKDEITARKAEARRAKLAAAVTVNNVVNGQLAPTAVQPKYSPKRQYGQQVTNLKYTAEPVGVTVGSLASPTGVAARGAGVGGVLPAGVPLTLSTIMEATAIQGSSNKQGQSSSSSSSTGGVAPEATSVDYTDLSLEDKQRVLQMLLHKVKATENRTAIAPI